MFLTRALSSSLSALFRVVSLSKTLETPLIAVQDGFPSVVVSDDFARGRKMPLRAINTFGCLEELPRIC